MVSETVVERVDTGQAARDAPGATDPGGGVHPLVAPAASCRGARRQSRRGAGAPIGAGAGAFPPFWRMSGSRKIITRPATESMSSVTG